MDVRFSLVVATTVFLGLLSYFLLWPVAIEPAVWVPPRAPHLSSVYEANNLLAGTVRLMQGAGIGPEDVAFDSEGRLYAGMADGRIVRAQKDGFGVERFVQTSGRPLGLEFDQAGNLVVADAVNGLLSVSPAGEIAVLATREGGLPFLFANDLDVAADGTVYFTDASWRHGPRELFQELIALRPYGRLLAYDPQTRTVTRLLDGLYFANGVAVSRDGTFVLVAETFAYRVTRYWLKGPRQGQSEVFIGNLPGFPDGISLNGRGLFWLALYAPRDAMLDRLMPYPFLRKMLLRLPEVFTPGPVRYGFVLGLDESGRVVQNLQDPKGGFAPISSAVQHGGVLYLGSLLEPAVGRVPLQ